jgi:uncharacterized protein YceK
VIRAFFLVLCVLFCGCSTLTVRQDFTPKAYNTLAVLPFDGDLDAGIAFQGGLEETLLGCGLTVVDRITVLQGLRRAGPENLDYRQLGIWFHAQLLIEGGFTLNQNGIDGVTYRGVRASDGLIQFSGSLGPGGSARVNGGVVGEKVCMLFGRAVR